MHLEFIAAAATHVGLVRSQNEDSFATNQAASLWAVCDGMGGHADGAWCSQTLTQALLALEPASANELLARTHDAIVRVNADIYAYGRRLGRTMGTTVVALLVSGHHFAGLWVGDSRLYRLRRGSLEQITTDHSLVQEQINAGLLAPEDAERSPDRHVLTRAVGPADSLEIEVVYGLIEPLDLFLLCSDGMNKLVSDQEIARILDTDQSLEARAHALIEAALKAGGIDNITVLLVAASPSAEGFLVTNRVPLPQPG